MSIDKLFAGKKPNILLLMNDQQRALQHWPDSWAAEHLPAMQRLKKHGLSFDLGFTVACACSASRGSLLTGTYPTFHGVKNTLVMPGGTSGALNPGGLPLVLNVLRPTDPNLARILARAGYTAVWKGKWHLSEPRNGGATWTEDDIRYMREAYGFDRWNPNDAGNSEVDLSTLGAGAGGNDERYMSGKRESGDTSPPGESIEEFLRAYDPADGPFFLTVSLVNPHDVWVAPTFADGCGYSADEVPDYGLDAPDTYDEPLELKPAAQAYWKAVSAATGGEVAGPENAESRALYVNFYAYLQTLTDAKIQRVLDLLDERGLTDDTLIVRVADHGEMGLSHGLREKEFVAYDEAIRIPIVFSNPVAFPEARRNDSLVANIDIAPTLARLAGVYEDFAPNFQGQDLTPILRGTADAVQESVHYMTDDASAPAASTPNLPIFIRALRTRGWMYSVYYDPAIDGTASPADSQYYQFELYDLQADPDQSQNLAGRSDYQDRQTELHAMLEGAMRKLDTVPPGFLLWTPALQEVIDQNDGSIGSPVWPTADQAFQASVSYREQAGWTDASSSSDS